MGTHRARHGFALIPAFLENMDFFNGLRRADECAMALARRGVLFERIRILPEGVVIHIKQPLPLEGDFEIKDGYASVVFERCRVAWKVEETSNE